MGGVYASNDGHSHGCPGGFRSGCSTALTQQLLSWWLSGFSSLVVILFLPGLDVTQRLLSLCPVEVFFVSFRAILASMGRVGL